MEELPDFYKEKKKETFSLIFVKSFLLLIVILGAAFGLRYFFSWVVFEKINREILFEKIHQGKEQERVVASQEWLRQLQNDLTSTNKWKPLNSHLAYINSELEASLIRLNFENPTKIASFMGILGYADDHKDFFQSQIVKFMKVYEKEEALSSAMITGIMSLARLSPFTHTEVFNYFLSFAKDKEAFLRKTFSFSSGIVFLNEKNSNFLSSTQESLAQLLYDEVEDVRWNAAFALASVKDFRAKEVLKNLIDDADKSGREESNPLTENKLQIFEECFRASLKLGELELRDKIYKISQYHPHLKLRQAAKKFIER